MTSEELYSDEFINLNGNYIHKTAIIYSNVEIGKGNIIRANTVIGSNGEMRKPKDYEGTNIDFQKSFKGRVIIGSHNVISEHVTIQRPYDENAATYIGSNNIIMAHSHIGHDAIIADDCEICTGVIIGGYSIIKSHVKLKLGVTVRNRLTIGRGALVGLGGVVVKDVEDGEVVYGNPAK